MPTRLIGVNIMHIIGIRCRSGADLARIWRNPLPPSARAAGVFVYKNAHTPEKFKL